MNKLSLNFIIIGIYYFGSFLHVSVNRSDSLGLFKNLDPGQLCLEISGLNNQDNYACNDTGDSS